MSKGEKEQENINFQNKFTIVLIISVLVNTLAIFVIISGFNFANFATAISDNYTKVDGGQLTKNDWNNLPNDFVDQSGDSMDAPLRINGHATMSGELRLASSTNANNYWALYSHYNYGDLNFWYGTQGSPGLNLMTFKKDSGNIGINNSDPQAKLQVNGRIKANDPVDNNDVVTKNYFNKIKVASGQNIGALAADQTEFTNYSGRQPVMPYIEIDLSVNGFDCSKDSDIIVSHNYVAGSEKPFQAVDAIKCKYIKNGSNKCKFLVECGGSIINSDGWFASTFDWLAIQLP